jgi:Uroporphyrinogen decarboxylase (URO-D)
MTDEPKQDGIHAMVPRERMTEAARVQRDTYAITPGVRFLRKEFGYYCLDEWAEQGLAPDADKAALFQYDGPGSFGLMGLGGCEAAFYPAFEERIVEDRGEHEVIQDAAGRHKLVFKGRRQGFMPEYIDHPVKDQKTWEENCKWRMDPESPERYGDDFRERIGWAEDAAAEGRMVCQLIVGGYMYLRSLIGPTDLLYAFYDMPEVVHDCMRSWLTLADAVTARHQRHVTFDEILLDEDITYNHGPLISPEMMKEFLFPYYQQLLANIRRRQIDPTRHLFMHLGTDGQCEPLIDIYGEATGLDVMSPFEVASGCDVVEIGRKYPNLVIGGGIDKRELAKGPKAIDAMLERIFPPMLARGGYMPTCDHGVPAEVSLEDYMYYRKRAIELGG